MHDGPDLLAEGRAVVSYRIPRERGGGSYQIFTRCSGATYILSPGCTLKAA
jgi:hypothetical protein